MLNNINNWINNIFNKPYVAPESNQSGLKEQKEAQYATLFLAKLKFPI